MTRKFIIKNNNIINNMQNTLLSINVIASYQVIHSRIWTFAADSLLSNDYDINVKLQNV